MNKLTKKFLLSFSLGLAAVGSVVPVTMTVVSCQSEDSKSILKKFIGKPTTIRIKNTDRELIGIVLNVDNQFIYLDRGGYSQRIIQIPLDISYITSYPVQYYSPMGAIELLSRFRDWVELFNYSEIEKQIQEFLNQIQDADAKKLGEEIFSIYQAHISYLTVDQIDKAVVDIVQNNSLSKWNELIDYYLDTFVLNREKFFEKLYELQFKHNVEIAGEFFQSITNICDKFHEIVFFGNINLI